MMKLSDEIVQRIVMFCQENEIAMAHIGSQDGRISMLLLAEKDITPNEAAIVSAHMLLTGVISGGFQEDNQRRAEEESRPIPKSSLN